MQTNTEHSSEDAYLCFVYLVVFSEMGLIYINHRTHFGNWKNKEKITVHNPGSNYISFTYLENQFSVGDRAVHGQTLNCNAHSLIMQWMVFPCNASPEAALLAVCWCEGYTVRGYMRFSEVTTCNSSFIPSLLLLKPAALLRNTNDLRFPRGNQAGLRGKMRKAGIQWCVRHRRVCVCGWNVNELDTGCEKWECFTQWLQMCPFIIASLLSFAQWALFGPVYPSVLTSVDLSAQMFLRCDR